jgi:parallel beta-helix repeat protein
MRIILRTMALAAAFAACPALAADLQVGGDGSYKTIAAALEAASPGDTILVARGNYRGHLDIAKAVTILGEEGVVFASDRKGAGIVLTAPGIVLSGFEVRNAGSRSGEAGIVVRANDARLEKLRVTHNLNGIVLSGVRNVTVTSSDVSANTHDGIVIDGGSANHIGVNRLADNGRAGIWLAGTHGRDKLQEAAENEVNGNTAVGNASFGIALNTGANRNVVKANEVSGNGKGVADAGILLNCGPQANVVEANHVTGNRDHGILLVVGAMANKVTGNEVSDNATGIGVYDASGNELAGNRVSDNRHYGIRLDDMSALTGKAAGLPGVGGGAYPVSTQNLLHHNDLMNNDVNAFDASGRPWKPMGSDKLPPETLKAMRAALAPNSWDDGTTGNYYDDFDEPGEGFIDQDGNGIGDTAHAIPGGTAVDRFALAAATVKTQ